MSNERKASMPSHCGNCIFHEWDEKRSTCMHPCKVDREKIARKVAEMVADGETSAYAIAESLLDDARCDQEWQSYDSVCDNWRGRGCQGYPDRRDEEIRVRSQAVDEFTDFIASLI